MKAYIKIYDYLANIITRCDGTNLTLPSENELCQIFGVTRPTVRYALKDLLAEGLVISVRGKGTYINWEKVRSYKTNQVFKSPRIGIISGKSKSIDSYLPMELITLLNRHGYYYEMIHMSEINDIGRFLAQKAYAAIIWIWPSETKFRQELESLDIPLLALNHRLPFSWNMDQITDHLDYENPDCVLSHYLCSHGHKSMYYVPISPNSLLGEKSSWISTFCTAVNKFWQTDLKPEDVIMPFDNLDEALEKIVEGNTSSTLLYCQYNLVPHVIKKTNQYKLKIPEDVSLLSWEKPENLYLPGKTITYLGRQETMNEKLYEWLKLRLIDNNRTGRFLSETKVTVCHGDSVKTQQY